MGRYFAGEKKIKLTCKEVAGATYQIAVKRVGASGWKRYEMSEPSAVIKGLKSGKKYRVRARAVCEIEGEYYKGEWSEVKSVTVK